MSELSDILTPGQDVSMLDLRNWLETNTPLVDPSNSRLRAGYNVGPHHILTSVRTQGGADMTGFGFIAVGADIASGTNNDATTTTGIGTANLTVQDVLSYGIDFHGFRALEMLEDGLYGGAFCIDAFKDVTYLRNSVATGAKCALYCDDVQSTTLNGVLAGAGGGALESVIVIGTSACDNAGGTDRTLLKNAVVIGDFACRNASGEMLSVIIGNAAVQNPEFTGTNLAGIGHGIWGAATTLALSAGLGYGAGSTLTSQSATLSLGALADAKFGGSSAVGYNAVTTGASQLQLGASGVTTYAYGAVQDRSDARDKTDIRDASLGLDFIRAVPWREFRWNKREDYSEVTTRDYYEEQPVDAEIPVPTGLRDARGRHIFRAKKIKAKARVPKTEVIRTFDEKAEKAHAKGKRAGKRFHLGVVAQELKEVCDKLGVDFAGLQHHAFHNNDPTNDHTGEDVWSVGYQEFIPALGRAVQEIADRQDAIEARLKKLEKAG